MRKLRETIHIYHTNDLHSHLENWPSIHHFLSERRKEHASDASLTLDIGDHVDRSNIYTEGTLGKGNVKLLNDAQYDYATIGNNEGITLSHEELDSLYEQAKFEVIVSNFTDLEGNIPRWVKPYKIHQTASGIRIGIIAATADYSVYYEKLGWRLQDPLPRLQAVADQISPHVDVLICMSHLGKSKDEELCELIPSLDLILGAHTHHLFEDGKMFGNTLQAATGKFGMYVGYVNLEYDHSLKRVVSKKAVVFPTSELPAPKNAGHTRKEWEKIGKEQLSYAVFTSNSILEKEWFNHSGLANFFGKALLSYTNADCAMFPAGIFLTDLPKGPVTAWNLHQCLPHPINPCIVTLSGAELLEVIELAKNDKWPNLEVKGLGFRGKYLGAILYERIEEDVDGKPLIKGEPLMLNETYRLATLDMFTFGFFFPSFKTAKKQYIMPETIRDVVKWYGIKEQQDKCRA
ncbi:bifunctional UDP-sugar hydrolase/5'-nucleotidase [Psychrobacillus sp. FSL W7-1493]|uniref:bifunctional metallophosphatase/5'-nucleotidase n=1 Tax=Psychrobacillus sp. FSL W7-1493 TaxID=2921552 RepID=UPI0030FA469A